MSDLKSKEGGTIPSSATQVRYAVPAWWQANTVSRYLAATNCFSGLEEFPPPEVPIATKQFGGGRRARYVQSPGVPPSFGATQPVWVTVNIPKDANAGDYEGNLTISADGIKPVAVPVHLKVCGWKLPDPHDFVTWAGFVQSPESVAIQYNVPLWSAEHFKYMEKSMKLLGQVGNKATYIHLICRTNAGNAETMVRWIKDGEGKYKYDFAPMDKYLDLVEKYAGKPVVVCLYVWDKHCNVRDKMENGPVARRHNLAVCTGEVPVSCLEGRGETSEIRLPPYVSPGSKELWKPLIDGIRERLRIRGLDKTMMFGVSTDIRPTKEVVEFFKEISPGTPWVSQSHCTSRGGSGLYGVPFGYLANVFSSLFAGHEDPKYVRGWQRPDIVVHYPRSVQEYSHLLYFRMMGEMNIAGYHRGFGRIGADFWNVLKGKRKAGSISARFPGTSWANLNIRAYVLSAGKDGAISTHGFEMFREGLQECEARVFIERALTDKTLKAKLGEALAERCQKMLDERIPYIRIGTSTLACSGTSSFYYTCNNNCWMTLKSETAPTGYYWYVGSDWQERSAELYSAAAEVQKALGVK